MEVDRKFLRSLRIVSMVEGVSTLVLFGIAMPLKYGADMPVAVTLAGPIHGFLFMVLVSMFLLGRKKIPLSPRLTAAGIAAAIFPFGPFIVDGWLGRVGE